MTIKPVNFRPEFLEDAILDKLHMEYGMPKEFDGKQWSKSELVRFCIRVAGEHLIDEEDFKEILLYSARF